MSRTEERARAIERSWAERGSTEAERRELAVLWHRLGCPGRDPRVAPVAGDVVAPGFAFDHEPRFVVGVAPESWAGPGAWRGQTSGTVMWRRRNQTQYLDRNQTLRINSVAPDRQHNTWQADMRGARVIEYAGGIFKEPEPVRVAPGASASSSALP